MTPVRHRPPRPAVTYGPGAVHRLAEVVAGEGAQRVLLVCGRRSFEASGAASALPALEAVAAVTRWSDFSPNTDGADLANGLEVVRASQPDVVVGVGGGSSMDMAKLVCAYEHVEPEQLHGTVRAGAPVTARRRGLVLIPTTSGSGSEATHFAVVYLGDDKFSVAGPAMYPDTVVLDPELAASGSPHQRATSGIDAVCQAIESLWAVGSTAYSRRRARHGLHLLLGAIEAFVHRPDDRSARAMSIGSHLAGRAIDVSKTTAAHALSYGITKRYGVSHGNAVALTLGQFIEAHAEAPRSRLQPGVDESDHRAALGTVVAALGASDGADARERFVGLLERIGLPARLGEVGPMDAAARAALVAGVNVERLGNNPVRFEEHDLLDVLERAT